MVLSVQTIAFDSKVFLCLLNLSVVTLEHFHPIELAQVPATAMPKAKKIVPLRRSYFWLNIN